MHGMLLAACENQRLLQRAVQDMTRVNKLAQAVISQSLRHDSVFGPAFIRQHFQASSING
jgi:hypothetical protein